MNEMFENKTYRLFAIIIALVTLFIFFYMLSLGEGLILSFAVPLLIGGLAMFKLYNYFKKQNPFVKTESLAVLYTELSQYDPDLLKVFSQFSNGQKRMTLSDLQSIRNTYAASINYQQLQQLINDGNEESQYKVDQYNYSLSLLDELIEQTQYV